jgi:hypothetical protein
LIQGDSWRDATTTSALRPLNVLAAGSMVCALQHRTRVERRPGGEAAPRMASYTVIKSGSSLSYSFFTTA